MRDPVAAGRRAPARLYRYEVRIRTRVGPAAASWITRAVRGSVVPPLVVRRLVVMREDDGVVDLPAVLRRLTECEVAVVEARLCTPDRRGGGTP